MGMIERRRFLQFGAASTVAGLAMNKNHASATAAAMFQSSSERTVKLYGDGLGLTPTDSVKLLTRLIEENPIARDSYSNGGEVEKLEQIFAAALGKESAVFMPTGTLANHLAVRILAGGPSRAIVQAESHLYNDTGDTVQTLSNIQLIPLAPSRATFTLARCSTNR